MSESMYLKKFLAVYEHLYSQSPDEPKNKGMKQKKNIFLEGPSSYCKTKIIL